MAARLTHAQRSVALALALRADSKTGAAWPSVATLANDAHCQPTAARGAIRQLEALGLVKVGWSAGRLANTYRLALAPAEPEVNPSPSRKVKPKEGRPTLRLGDGNPSAARRQPFGCANPELAKELAKELEEYAPASRARATPSRLPSNWEPDKAAIEWIASFGLTPQEAAPVLSEFRQYWAERTTKRADWSLAFRRNGRAEAGLIRLRNAKQGTRPAGPGGTGPEPVGAAYQPFRGFE
jgi:hypothetical protein